MVLRVHREHAPPFGKSFELVPQEFAQLPAEVALQQRIAFFTLLDEIGQVVYQRSHIGKSGTPVLGVGDIGTVSAAHCIVEVVTAQYGSSAGFQKCRYGKWLIAADSQIQCVSNAVLL